MSLDSLRKLRGQAVEALMMELGHIAQSLSRSEERYRKIETEMVEDANTYSQQTQQGLTIEAMLEWQVRMYSQQTALRQAHLVIEQETLSWQRINKLLVEANQECKLLDRILEQREATQCAEVARQEQRATDEAASRRYLLR
ncbi:MAG: flagellar FliJ family protein [Nitrospira sp.]|nr:flagellar FliJ family protein [Nitrospira sp.]MDH5726239.1 flagellar FliJ family protein [Nitrospira sp.]